MTINYRHIFINPLVLIHSTYVKQNRTTDKGKTGRDRAPEGDSVFTGYNRCPAKQEAHRRGIVCSMRRFYGLRREETETGKSREGKSRKENQEYTKRPSILNSIPSFLFSNNSITLLMALDDICAQINPILWSMTFK